MGKRRAKGITAFTLWLAGHRTCGICWKPIDNHSEANVDHIIPLSDGGRKTADNLQIAHIKCNSQKKSIQIPSFYQEQL
jgi:5-methylcytosine-specific restriction endonuclease McrA